MVVITTTTIQSLWSHVTSSHNTVSSSTNTVMTRMACVQARKPVLYVGGGCLDASRELREFVKKTGIPVASTLMGLGVFPDSDDLALQVCPPCPPPPLWVCFREQTGLGASHRAWASCCSSPPELPCPLGQPL